MLVHGHGAVVHLQDHQTEHHNNGQQGVEVVGNGPDEQRQAAAVLHEAGHSRRPGADGGNDADRRGGGVDEIGQLGPGDVLLVGDGPHDAAYGEAVEIVVNENQHAQQNAGQLSAGTALDVVCRPPAEGRGAAGLVHQADHGAQNHQENQDTHVVAVGEHADDAVLEHMQDRSLKGEVGVEQAAYHNADEQRGIDLLGQQSQADGDHRGEQGQGRVEKAAGGRDIARVLTFSTGLTGDGLPLVGQHHAHGRTVGALDILGAVEFRGVLPGGKGGGDQAEQEQEYGRSLYQPAVGFSHKFSLQIFLRKNKKAWHAKRSHDKTGRSCRTRRKDRLDSAPQVIVTVRGIFSARPRHGRAGTRPNLRRHFLSEDPSCLAGGPRTHKRRASIHPYKIAKILPCVTNPVKLFLKILWFVFVLIL